MHRAKHVRHRRERDAISKMKEFRKTLHWRLVCRGGWRERRSASNATARRDTEFGRIFKRMPFLAAFHTRKIRCAHHRQVRLPIHIGQRRRDDILQRAELFSEYRPQVARLDASSTRTSAGSRIRHGRAGHQICTPASPSAWLRRWSFPAPRSGSPHDAPREAAPGRSRRANKCELMMTTWPPRTKGASANVSITGAMGLCRAASS